MTLSAPDADSWAQTMPRSKIHVFAAHDTFVTDFGASGSGRQWLEPEPEPGLTGLSHEAAECPE